MNYSHYQKAILDFALNDQGNGCISAVAGSGKTTTGVDMVSKFDPLDQGAYMAFSKTIETELKTRIKAPNCLVKTYNAFGNSILGSQLPRWPKLNKEKTQNTLRYEVLKGKDLKSYYKCRFMISKLISLFKNMYLIEPQNYVAQIIERFDLDIPEHPDFDSLLFETYKLVIEDTKVIDFDDQKFMPLYLGLDIPQFDFLVIDEFQDTCNVESKLLMAACERGRVVVFGDPDQCIYSFKGTTPDAMSLFIAQKNARELPLSICYRCPKLVVAEAQKIVPRIEAAPDAINGTVDTISKSTYFSRATGRDIVLGRVTLDLVSSCLYFIREGRAAYVEGKELGEKLIRLVDRISRNDDNLDDGAFFHLMNEHEIEQTDKLTKFDRDNQILQLQDSCETLRVLLHEVSNVSELKDRIKALFKDNSTGIRHMTAHKSKGLEGHKDGDVYILRPDKFPHARAKQPWMREEENRLLYVARTRSRRGLYYVLKDVGEK